MSTEKKLTIRIHVELHAQLVALAANDLRSLNAEITKLIQEAIASRRDNPA